MDSYYTTLQGMIVKKDYCIRFLKPSELFNLKKIIDESILKYDNEGITEEYVNKLNKLSSISFKGCNPKRKTEKVFNSDLYLVHNKTLNILKIGISKDVPKRFRILSQEGFYEFELLFTIKNKSEFESIFHEKYKKLRIIREWFDYDISIIDDFINLKNENYG